MSTTPDEPMHLLFIALNFHPDRLGNAPIITGQVVGSNSLALTTPIAVTATGLVQIGPGTHVILWIVRDASGSIATATQTVVITAGMQTSNSFIVEDRATVRVPSGAGSQVNVKVICTPMTRLRTAWRLGGSCSMTATSLTISRFPWRRFWRSFAPTCTGPPPITSLLMTCGDHFGKFFWSVK